MEPQRATRPGRLPGRAPTRATEAETIAALERQFVLLERRRAKVKGKGEGGKDVTN